MLKKISNQKLILIFAVLAVVYLGFELLGGKSHSKSLKEELVTIDTAKVSKLVIESKGETLELVKGSEGWQVALGNGKFADAEKGSVMNTLNTLLSVKPARIAAKNPDKWKDYQVDSAGTRVQVFEGNDNTLDLVVGRFGFDQEAMRRQQMTGGRGPQKFYSFVRLYDENEVYVADNFMGMSLTSESSNYRNKKILTLNADSLASIRFDYPADSSFVLEKSGDSWTVSGLPTDSASVAGFINNISYLSSNAFIDDLDKGTLMSPAYSVYVTTKGNEVIEINAYQDPKYKLILHSSENPKAYFSDEALVQKLFIGKERLINQ